jgi:hypothetical protein
MNIDSGMTYVLKTLSVDADKGTANVETTTTVTKFESDSPLGQVPDPKNIKPLVQTGTIDKFGHLVLGVPKNADPMQMMMSGGSNSISSTMFVELPNHPVQVGDSWDVIVPKGPFTGPDDQKLTAKLTGEKQDNGHDVYTVEVTGHMNITFDSSKLPTPTDTSSPAAQQFIVKSAVDVDGTGEVDKATGKTISLESTEKMKSNINLTQLGMDLDSTGTVKSTVTLKTP